MRLPTITEYPDRVRVRDVWFTVEFKNPGKKTSGSCTPDWNEKGLCTGGVILIQPGLSLTESFGVYWHEVFHAWEYVYLGKKSKKKVPHWIIYMLEAAMLDYWVTNSFKWRK